ncbi:hypothetical protein C0991_008730 [Blastosporella zonata]|nr:hypothetical protein C0991_008730 [Blastosporella zonata]
MIRTTIARSARSILVRNTLLASRPAFPAFQIRLESNIPPKIRTPEEQARKDAKDRMNELQHDWDAKEITYAELKPRTNTPVADTYLIDVREPEEVVQGMIPSAVNLPLSDLGNSLHLNPATFLEKHGFDKPGKDQQLIFYCRSGKRSTTASDVAKRNGFTKYVDTIHCLPVLIRASYSILNYKGSWLEWVEKENIRK